MSNAISFKSPKIANRKSVRLGSQQIVVVFPKQKHTQAAIKQINEKIELQCMIAEKTQLAKELTIRLGFAEAGLAILTEKLKKLDKNNT